MGTPASVACDPPGRAPPAARGRKRASANIFQGVGLPELRSLFRSGGAERPEERARLVCRYAGQRRMARALRRLRRRPAAPGGGMAATRRSGRLRLGEQETASSRGDPAERPGAGLSCPPPGLQDRGTQESSVCPAWAPEGH
ncbi:arginine vasopressin-induced protein 1 [Apteryx mantelli]|uniref:Arginine vasopressin-induced protein 1 n=1 Tax=Apteryx mantelli TaxID=2696672 RepID=A0ABM4EU49_9AVES